MDRSCAFLWNLFLNNRKKIRNVWFSVKKMMLAQYIISSVTYRYYIFLEGMHRNKIFNQVRGWFIWYCSTSTYLSGVSLSTNMGITTGNECDVYLASWEIFSWFFCIICIIIHGRIFTDKFDKIQMKPGGIMYRNKANYYWGGYSPLFVFSPLFGCV